MKNRVLPVALAGSLLLGSASLQGCYGQFGLTRKLYTWNGTVGDKWINSIILFALSAVQVYTVVVLADGIVFNTMEFWTGKNPVTLSPGERETRVVSVDGKDFVVTATQNRMDIVPAQGGPEPLTLKFDPSEQTWSATYDGKTRTIAEQDEDVLTLLHEDGSTEAIRR
jgi:hypothetical protein